MVEFEIHLKFRKYQLYFEMLQNISNPAKVNTEVTSQEQTEVIESLRHLVVYQV